MQLRRIHHVDTENKEHRNKMESFDPLVFFNVCPLILDLIFDFMLEENDLEIAAGVKDAYNGNT